MVARTGDKIAFAVIFTMLSTASCNSDAVDIVNFTSNGFEEEVLRKIEAECHIESHEIKFHDDIVGIFHPALDHFAHRLEVDSYQYLPIFNREMSDDFKKRRLKSSYAYAFSRNGTSRQIAGWIISNRECGHRLGGIEFDGIILLKDFGVPRE